MFESIQHVAPAVAAIRRKWNCRPRAGLILGSGLGDLVSHIDIETRLDCASIPHFPQATAPGHGGALVGGHLAGVPIVALDGRVHGYEGHTAAEVAFGVRVMKALGIDVLILSNACGGMNPYFRPGDVMIVEDQVNLMFANPLVGRHDPSAGIRYPDMSQPFDRRLIERAAAVARRREIVAHRGVYVGVVGPNYETRAEYRILRRIADAVGMSTVHEVIVAVQCELRVLALAVVTNVCSPDRLKPATGHQVIAVAETAEPKLRAIVEDVLAEEFG